MRDVIDDPAWAATARVTVKRLAELLMVSPERIRQLAAAGVFDIGQDGKTSLQIALHAYCESKRASQR